jgi:hypothetical protein
MPKGRDQRPTATHPAQRTFRRCLQLSEVARAEVGDLVRLQGAPDVLDGIHLWRVGVKTLYLQPASRRIDEVPDESAPMSGQTITDHEHQLLHASHEMREELYDLRPLNKAMGTCGQFSHDEPSLANLGRPPAIGSPTGSPIADGRSGAAQTRLRLSPSPAGRPPRVAGRPKLRNPVEHPPNSPSLQIQIPNRRLSLSSARVNRRLQWRTMKML